MLAVEVHEFGGPEVLVPTERPTPAPGPGEILVRHRAIGLNFIDAYYRTGFYPTRLPAILGSEGAGMVEAVGENVSRFKPGDRVAYAQAVGGGAYAEARTLPADRAVAIPDGVSDDLAAAVMLKGMTAEFLLRRCFPVSPGDAILVHAAAGGVGGLLVQWAKALGARVIGTAGSPDKAAVALSLGADAVILYREQDVAQRVRDLTGGEGVAVVYDSVGKDTFDGSLASLRRRGWLVSFGNASGPPPPLDPLRLMRGGSLILTRPTLVDYIATTEDLDASASAVFTAIQSGAVQPRIGQRFALKDAADAHRALEGRKTTGATVLIP